MSEKIMSRYKGFVPVLQKEFLELSNEKTNNPI